MKYNGRTACAESHLLQVIRSRKTWLGVSLSDVLDYVAWAHENTTCTGSDMPPFCWIPVRYPRPLITMSEHTRICTDRTYMGHLQYEFSGWRRLPHMHRQNLHRHLQYELFSGWRRLPHTHRQNLHRHLQYESSGWRQDHA